MRAPDFLSLNPLLPRCLASLVLLAPLLAQAQSAGPAPGAAGVAVAADPSAHTAPLAHQGLPPQPALEDAPPATAWRDAHGAVAAFPRGHADILAWEARQGMAPAGPSTGARHQGHTP
jgi:hypothetical protein